jgi:hypothetical protein
VEAVGGGAGHGGAGRWRWRSGLGSRRGRGPLGALGVTPSGEAGRGGALDLGSRWWCGRLASAWRGLGRAKPPRCKGRRALRLCGFAALRDLFGFGGDRLFERAVVGSALFFSRRGAEPQRGLRCRLTCVATRCVGGALEGWVGRPTTTTRSPRVRGRPRRWSWGFGLQEREQGAGERRGGASRLGWRGAELALAPIDLLREARGSLRSGVSARGSLAAPPWPSRRATA